MIKNTPWKARKITEGVHAVEDSENDLICYVESAEQARIIAAAPEMFSLLERAERFFDSVDELPREGCDIVEATLSLTNRVQPWIK